MFVSRQAVDVLLDLEEQEEIRQGSVEPIRRPGAGSAITIAVSVIGILLAVTLIYSLGKVGVAASLFFASLGILVRGALVSGSKKAPIQNAERQLPLLLEQLVMYAQSGKDIPTCIESIVENDQERAWYPRALIEPFEKLITRSRSGVGFSECLASGAAEAQSPLVRHVFMYLIGGYRDGTEVCSLLTELSDATQQLVEDRAEERIAKLPALATAPLIISFSGLLLIFLSIPLLRILGQLKEHAL
jgi:hypothetical protein